MITIILSLLILTSAVRLLNMEVIQLHQEQLSRQLDIEITSHLYYFASYIMLILGVILLVVSIMAVKRNIMYLELKFRPHDKRTGVRPSDRPIKRMLLIMLYLTIIALFFIPLLPYFGITGEREKQSDNYNEEPDKIEVTDFTIGNPFYLEVVSSYGFYNDYENINDDLWAISAMTWLTLIFLILGFIGLAIHSMNRWRIVYISLFIIAAISVLIFSILILTFHGLMIKDIFKYGSDELSGDAKIFFGYNYFPFIMAILMLVFSILFLSFIIKYSRPVIIAMLARGRMYGYQPYPPPPGAQQGPPPGPGQPPPPYAPPPPDVPPPRHEQPQRHDYGYGPQGYQDQSMRLEDMYGSSSQQQSKPITTVQTYNHSSSQVEYQRSGTMKDSYGGSRDKFCPSCGLQRESTPQGDYCSNCGKYF